MLLFAGALQFLDRTHVCRCVRRPVPVGQPVLALLAADQGLRSSLEVLMALEREFDKLYYLRMSIDEPRTAGIAASTKATFAIARTIDLSVATRPTAVTGRAAPARNLKEFGHIVTPQRAGKHTDPRRVEPTSESASALIRVVGLPTATVMTCQRSPAWARLAVSWQNHSGPHFPADRFHSGLGRHSLMMERALIYHAIRPSVSLASGAALCRSAGHVEDVGAFVEHRRPDSERLVEAWVADQEAWA